MAVSDEPVMRWAVGCQEREGRAICDECCKASSFVRVGGLLAILGRRVVMSRVRGNRAADLYRDGCREVCCGNSAAPG